MPSVISLILSLFLSFSPPASANEDDDGMVTKTIRGVQIRVPEDMPIKEKDGLIELMDMDDYLYKKTRELKAEIESLRTLTQSHDERLAEVEAQLKKTD